jgi:hypothetical protein
MMTSQLQWIDEFTYPLMKMVEWAAYLLAWLHSLQPLENQATLGLQAQLDSPLEVIFLRQVLILEVRRHR